MSDLIDRSAIKLPPHFFEDVDNVPRFYEWLNSLPTASPWHRVEDDAEFLSLIISEICSYSVKNEMEPDDSLRTVAQNILKLLKISTFNNWMPIEPPKNNFENPL